MAAVSMAAAALVFLAGQAFGQAIERNPAPAPQAPPRQPSPPIQADPNADATPLGVTLKGLYLAPPGVLPSMVPDGVDVTRIRALPGLARRLRTYIGQPLSRKLIGEIEAEVAQAYRQAGFPFVYLSSPPQKLSSGALIIRVDEFTLGAARLQGASAIDQARLPTLIRQHVGAPISAAQLAEDLDWINRYPFRRVEAVFSNGATADATDVTYTVQSTKPWSVGAGYANSGSPQTGENRYFVYGLAALPGVRDGYASYQLTTSGQTFSSLGPEDAGGTRYISHALRLTAPIAARQALEFTFANIGWLQPIQAFNSRNDVTETDLAYRFALSNLASLFMGDGYVGLSWKRQDSKVLFGSAPVSSAAYDVGQANLGYALSAYDPAGETDLDISLHLSPGQIDTRNADPTNASASQSASAKARYAYASGSLSRRTDLGFADLINALTWQYAASPLPQTEQLGLGGAAGVRAYSLDDGAFDTGLILRDELRAKPLAFGARGRLRPYLYLDGGWAGRTQADPGKPISATGAGFDLDLGSKVSLSADAGTALETLEQTHAGDIKANVRLSVQY